ncbi:tRNA guanosine(34) transglycosylase Tgt, partial [Candidatus Uhrbacteria bacterium]|nr:tRNA guanosine(34) transglycosylase Tgt [Candidatus Uhrbacteria bacterium]
MFKILHSSSGSAARTGELQTNHGVLSTPFFMPIATRGAVKLLGSEDLEELGASVLLSNTYHLMLRPGTEVIKALGGLHSFMRWNHPILTDSGGYQVFSLTAWRRLTEEGVWFRSPNGGAEHFLSPERSMEIQHLLGSDMVMVFDECTEYPVSGERAQESMELTTRWAKRSKEAYQGMGGRGLLFGIAQGSSFPELRKRSAEELREIGFDGYAIGGLSIGEDRQETYQLVNLLAGIFPVDRPRYFMGAGKPEEIVEYVRRGMDMFDCVLPTRDGRHGLAYRFTDEARLMISNSR